MLEVTSPMLLDSTGQSMLTALNTIATNVAMKKVQFIFGPLPATGVAGNFYFVRNSKSSGSNLYDEYVWDANASRFELISSNIEIDAVPTNGSTNPVSSDGVYDALQAIIAQLGSTYSIQSTYDKGDVVVYNGELYQANQDISTAEAWTVAHWDKKTVADLVVVMTGATSSVAGASGLVPAPGAGDQGKVLKGDGTWGEVSVDPTSCTTTFSQDGSTITQTYATKTLTTVFNANGTITETMTDNSTSAVIYTKITTFNQDGSISEVVS